MKYFLFIFLFLSANASALEILYTNSQSVGQSHCAAQSSNSYPYNPGWNSGSTYSGVRRDTCKWNGTVYFQYRWPLSPNSDGYNCLEGQFPDSSGYCSESNPDPSTTPPEISSCTLDSVNVQIPSNYTMPEKINVSGCIYNTGFSACIISGETMSCSVDVTADSTEIPTEGCDAENPCGTGSEPQPDPQQEAIDQIYTDPQYQPEEFPDTYEVGENGEIFFDYDDIFGCHHDVVVGSNGDRSITGTNSCLNSDGELVQPDQSEPDYCTFYGSDSYCDVDDNNSGNTDTESQGGIYNDPNIDTDGDGSGVADGSGGADNGSGGTDGGGSGTPGGTDSGDASIDTPQSGRGEDYEDPTQDAPEQTCDPNTQDCSSESVGILSDIREILRQEGSGEASAAAAAWDNNLQQGVQDLNALANDDITIAGVNVSNIYRDVFQFPTYVPTKTWEKTISLHFGNEVFEHTITVEGYENLSLFRQIFKWVLFVFTVYSIYGIAFNRPLI